MALEITARATMPPGAAFQATATWAARAGTALSEQGLFAGVNFLLNALLAASMPPAEFGAFAVAFTVFMIASGFYNALVLEPATVLRTSLYDTQPRSYCRAQLVLHGGVTTVLATGVAVAALVLGATGLNVPIGRALAGAAVALPFILLLWLARRFLYVLRRPAAALAGSALYLLAVVAGIAVIRRAGVVSPFSGFVVFAGASGVSAAFMLWRAGAFGGAEPVEPVGLRRLFGERWRYGRWLLGAVCVEATIVPGLIFLTTALLGLGAVGILRAMQLFAAPFGHAVTALSTLALPDLARDVGGGRVSRVRSKAALVVTIVVAGALLFEVGLLAFQRPLEWVVYGGKFADYTFLIPILGAAALLEGMAATYAMLLSALQRPRLYLASVAMTAPIALATGVVCIRLWQIEGAAITFVVTAAVSALVRRTLARRQLSAGLVPARSPAF